MDNESMYAELLELITTDSASGKESAIARLLIGKLEALGFAVTMDNAGETFGGECGNVLASGKASWTARCCCVPTWTV